MARYGILARLAGASLAVLVAAAACQQPRDANGNPIAAIPTDSTAYFRDQLAATLAVSAEKDALITDLAETTKLITDVSSELATINSTNRSVTVPTGGDVAGPANARAEVLAKVKDLTTRVKRSEARLAATQRRLRALTQESDSMKIVMAAYASSIAELQQVVEGQKATIVALTEELIELRTQNTQLAESNATLTDTIGLLSTRENMVYYVVGTRKELREKGLIVEEGGTRFLLFTRTGETIRPAAQLDASLFTRVDRRELKELPMPKADKQYRIVSRQDLSYASAPALNKKGEFRTGLQITSPADFWSTSKFLIIVEN